MAGSDQIEALEQRVARLESIIVRQALVASGALPCAPEARRVTYPTTWPDGRARKQLYPKFWHDAPVREAVIERHRKMTIAQAVAEIAYEFGHDRAPSKSALQRAWKALDVTTTPDARQPALKGC